jgi:AraC family transcriptional regulator
MSILHIELKRPEDRRLLFSEDGVRTSSDFGWESLYFECREADAFETVDHTLDGHYLMVKLNALSKAERRIDGKTRKENQRRGNTTYVPHGCAHRVRYITSLGCLNFMTVSKAAVDDVANELGITQFAGVPSFADHEDRFILEAALSIDRELADGNPHGPLYAQTYARVLAAHIVTRYRGVQTAIRHPVTLSNTKMRWLEEYVEFMLAHPISLSQMAEQVGLSPYYFCRVFKNTTGMPPYQYILHKRVEFACSCLKTDNMSLQDIAFTAGFSDASQFSKQFKLIAGITPSAFRLGQKRQIRA